MGREGTVVGVLVFMGWVSITCIPLHTPTLVLQLVRPQAQGIPPIDGGVHRMVL